MHARRDGGLGGSGPLFSTVFDSWNSRKYGGGGATKKAEMPKIKSATTFFRFL
jgi:hypothetical protein